MNKDVSDTSGKESTCQWRRHKGCRFDPWVRKILWRRKWQPTPVFLPGKSHGQRSLVGYGLWGCKELDMTEQLNLQRSSDLSASLVVQLVKNLPAMWETWVGSLGWEDPLEKGGHGNPLQYSCLENPYRQSSLVAYSPWGHKESDMTEWLSIKHK